MWGYGKHAARGFAVLLAAGSTACSLPEESTEAAPDGGSEGGPGGARTDGGAGAGGTGSGGTPVTGGMGSTGGRNADAGTGGADGGSGDPDAADGDTGIADATDGCVPNACGVCGDTDDREGARCGNCGHVVCRDGGVACEGADFATVVSVQAGGVHSCALLSGGAVRCWGDNDWGSLGDGTLVASNLAAAKDAATGAKALSVGYGHACVQLEDDTVRCWGQNSSGQLGDGTLENRSTAVPVVGLAGKVEKVVAGSGGYSCAILAGTRAVQCWGDNRGGQLGDGSLDNSSRPVTVQGVVPATTIALGRGHACAILPKGHIKCWGGNLKGQLGDGTMESSPTAVDVALAAPAAAVSLGADHSCALLETGGVTCWGWNTYGQLGDDSTSDSPKPVSVVGLSSGVVELSVNGFHSCARLADGTARCWGFNQYGGLGNDTMGNSSPVPVDVAERLPVLSISAGASKSHTCIRTGAGAKCFGPNDYGQLGDGTYLDRAVPVRVQGLAGLCAP